jgi:hypothetical protein
LARGLRVALSDRHHRSLRVRSSDATAMQLSLQANIRACSQAAPNRTEQRERSGPTTARRQVKRQHPARPVPRRSRLTLARSGFRGRMLRFEP